MVRPALDYIQLNEVTVDLQIPLIWKAVLILSGVVASIVTVGAAYSIPPNRALVARPALRSVGRKDTMSAELPVRFGPIT